MAGMIRQIDLYRVVGRRLTRKLLQAGWRVPVQNEPAGGTVFDAEKVHRALGRLTRDGYTLLPRAIVSTSEPKEARKAAPSLEEIVLDETELARLL